MPLPDMPPPSFWSSAWSMLTNVGAVAGIFALPYTMFQAMRNRPRIVFENTGTPREAREDQGHQYVNLNFNGNLKNRSNTPNSIVKIGLTVATNRSKSARLRDGFSGEKIFESSTEISLPIHLEPKQSRELNIVCSVLVANEDARLLQESVPRFDGNRFIEAKYNYELLFEDVNGNTFDMEGHFVNEKMHVLRWCDWSDAIGHLQRHFNPLPAVRVLWHMLRCWIRFRVRVLLISLGLSGQ